MSLLRLANRFGRAWNYSNQRFWATESFKASLVWYAASKTSKLVFLWLYDLACLRYGEEACLV